MGDSLEPVFGLEEVEGYWPSRILHVRSMTSFQRRDEGNGDVTYGGHFNPQYNILSYTWGRFRTRNDGEEGSAIDVDGLSWAIPRISVSRGGFGKQQFKNVISAVGEGVKFVWIDVACIPQRNGVQQSAKDKREGESEIGRQASIFMGAEDAYIWIYTMTTRKLDYAINQLRRHHLDLFEDSWFTSLWTLQEASLRKDATLLSAEGDFVEGPNGDPVTLEHIIDLFGRYLRDTNLERLPARLSGLESLAGRNPFPLLGVAHHRQVGDELDHVYGIMQVFNVRVGKAAGQAFQSTELNKLYTLFYQEVNKKSAVVSQAFRHYQDLRKTDPTWAPKIGGFSLGQPFVRGQGGSIQYDNTQIVPQDFYDMVELPNRLRAVVKPQSNGLIMVFRAHSISLRDLLEFLAQSKPKDKNSATCSVWMDAQFTPRGQVGNPYVVGKRDPKNADVPNPTKVAEGLISMTRDQRDYRDVLFMGSFETRGNKGYLGIIVSQVSDKEWIREGFCTWSAQDTSRFKPREERILR